MVLVEGGRAGKGKSRRAVKTAWRNARGCPGGRKEEDGTRQGRGGTEKGACEKIGLRITPRGGWAHC